MNLVISIVCLILVTCTIAISLLRRPKKAKESAKKETLSPISPKNPWAEGLEKSRGPLLSRLKESLASITLQEKWSDTHPLWESLEESLLAADLGPKVTELFLAELKKDFQEMPSLEGLKQKLRERMLSLLNAIPSPAPSHSKPLVTVLIGVNGAGKTTTAGKLAALAKSEGRKVILGAGDTFRAAAVEQLQTWAKRLDVECVAPAQGANPAAVAFDVVAAGLAREADEVILDTAGRLHTKDNLMDELKKVARVIDKKIPGAPHRVLLVLDATLGQNAIQQAREFTAAIPTTGIVLTKMDGSSRGGAVFAVSVELALPVMYIGLGETAEDLRPFHPQEFVDNLLPA